MKNMNKYNINMQGVLNNIPEMPSILYFNIQNKLYKIRIIIFPILWLRK